MTDSYENTEEWVIEETASELNSKQTGNTYIYPDDKDYKQIMRPHTLEWCLERSQKAALSNPFWHVRIRNLRTDEVIPISDLGDDGGWEKMIQDMEDAISKS